LSLGSKAQSASKCSQGPSSPVRHTFRSQNVAQTLKSSKTQVGRDCDHRLSATRLVTLMGWA
jgi:hypothetical protein